MAPVFVIMTKSSKGGLGSCVSGVLGFLGHVIVALVLLCANYGGETTCFPRWVGGTSLTVYFLIWNYEDSEPGTLLKILCTIGFFMPFISVILSGIGIYASIDLAIGGTSLIVLYVFNIFFNLMFVIGLCGMLGESESETVEILQLR